ncbi:MAG: division/cell wall cluster transcriptional repressor MraZ [Actinomycetota bacterium]
MSFTGEFRHAIDAKGRLIVPSRMRDELTGSRVVLTRWLEDCIAVWSQEGWDEMQTKLLSAGSSSRDARNFVRMVSSSAHEDEVDKQGRITVPQRLRDLAGITRDAIVIGALNRGEIWSPERWEQQRDSVDEEQFSDLAQAMSERGVNF